MPLSYRILLLSPEEAHEIVLFVCFYVKKVLSLLSRACVAMETHRFIATCQIKKQRLQENKQSDYGLPDGECWTRKGWALLHKEHHPKVESGLNTVNIKATLSLFPTAT